MKLYHGTSAEFAQQINKEGFQKRNENWDVSGDWIYFYPSNYESAKYDAFTQAGYTAALNFSNLDYVSVFECWAPSKYIKIDKSAPNMEQASRVELDNRKHIRILKEHKFMYYKDLRLFYLVGQQRNDYSKVNELDPFRKRVISDICGNFYDELYEMEYV